MRGSLHGKHRDALDGHFELAGVDRLKRSERAERTRDRHTSGHIGDFAREENRGTERAGFLLDGDRVAGRVRGPAPARRGGDRAACGVCDVDLSGLAIGNG